MAAKAFMAQDKTPLEIAEAGDFDEPAGVFLRRLGQALRQGRLGAVMARMDDGNAFRGWDLWLENDGPAPHIINHWPDNALKVVCEDARSSPASGIT